MTANPPKVRKVPSPPAVLKLDQARHIVEFQAPLWRVYRTQGGYPQTWDELRHFGPVDNMRFDPHPLPPGIHADSGVLYAATLPHTALGEVYQETRNIQRAFQGNAIVSWTPTRPLVLLDLTSNWPVINGGAASMQMDAKERTCEWARAIDQQFGADIDGLSHRSSINHQPMVTLFARTERIPAFPARPAFHALLIDPSADMIVDRAVQELGFTSS
ncbi:RES domain-containing protein [Microbacterium sp. K24]|uniref:RES domain-containing protein n=1 Tax=Microbacterium sp. K24 TaxID=2305446 RepID=UPI00109D783A|nr:RES domain-containing protein [Microbacterium sp. K24]